MSMLVLIQLVWHMSLHFTWDKRVHKTTQNKKPPIQTQTHTHTHTHARHRLHVGSVEEGTDLLQGEVLELQ